MENRSNHVLVGGVVLVLLCLTLGFIVWLAGFHTNDENKYDILFKTSVDGIAKGSAVTFSGVPVGKVDEIALVLDKPEYVRVRIGIKNTTPILQGTTATIAGVGFTGVSQINLDGAIRGAPAIDQAGPYGVPLIPPKAGGIGALLASAPQLLEKVTTLTDRLGQLLSPNNQRSMANILASTDRLSASLADRGPEIAATLAETRITMRQAGDAAQKLGVLADSTNGLVQSDVRPLLANLNLTIASARKSSEALNEAIGDARPGLKNFSTRTIPEVSQLVRDLTEMSESLNAVATRLDRGGAGALVGSGKLPDYKPRK